ncbi:TetR/AcrR family transcriptional regulator [Sphingobium sp. SCG-1]|uniref:TetR/AcrR family transcriptional regulator n=1 Tax=Sphingobium sp. SCG-1 TaxID=2072936 RepID=UPI0011AB6736|nr:TetR/AcrR family transcriptional regulator [Sphingobium sp. SCG-1]
MRKINPDQHRQKREDILAAAAHCFARHGFRGASIASICGEAGISPGHLYHYFESKEDIVEAIADTVVDRAAERFAEAASGGSVISTLVSQLEWSLARPGHFGTLLYFDMLAESGRTAGIARLLHNHHRKLSALLVDLLRHGQRQGEVEQSLDLDVTARMLMSVLEGSKTLALGEARRDGPAYIASFSRLLARFLMPSERA